VTYKVTLRKKAIKTLRKVNDPIYSKLKEAIYNLSTNPRPYGYIKLKGREAFRIRVADYRIIYEIFDDDLVVDVIDLGNRSAIYE
jgi:mRNA interferase RelE/StbE